MPVVTEPSADRAPRRRARWPLVLLGLLLFPLLLLLVPLVQPVTVRCGANVVLIGTAPVPPQAAAAYPHLFNQLEMQIGGLMPADQGRVYALDPANRTVRSRWLRLGRWSYYVTWFQGKRVR